MKKLLLILILLLVAATPLLANTTQGTCGDNICRADQNENKLTCPQDCGTLPESKIVFERVWTTPVPISNTQGGIQVAANFYYYNTTKLVRGNELDAAQHIDDARCVVELNNNVIEMTNYFSDIKYSANININEGVYTGLVKCTSSLGNKIWPIQFSRMGDTYYSQTVSPEKINEKSIQEINSSVYRDYVNLTEIIEQQKNQPAPASIFSLPKGLPVITGMLWLTILLMGYTFLAILYGLIRTGLFIINKILGKNTKLPKTAIAIVILTITSPVFFPILILIPIIMTLKIIHKIITLILPKPKLNK